jgi:hypothetical protein
MVNLLMIWVIDNLFDMWRRNTQACIFLVVVICSGIATYYFDRQASPFDVKPIELVERDDPVSGLIVWSARPGTIIGDFSVFWNSVFELLVWLESGLGTIPSLAEGTVLGQKDLLDQIVRGEGVGDVLTPELFKQLCEVR